jgi:hypothetical protein
MLDAFTVFMSVLFIVLAVITNFGLSIWGLSPVYEFHSGLMLLVRCMLLPIAVLIILLGPNGSLRWLSLVLLVPCAALGLFFSGWFIIGGWETQVWKSQDDAMSGDEIRHLGSDTYTLDFDWVWMSGDPVTFRLKQYQKINPYFRKKVREIELPVNHWPSFVSPAKDKLSIELRREQELLLTADVDDILSGRVKLGH